MVTLQLPPFRTQLNCAERLYAHPISSSSNSITEGEKNPVIIPEVPPTMAPTAPVAAAPAGPTGAPTQMPMPLPSAVPAPMVWTAKVHPSPSLAMAPPAQSHCLSSPPFVVMHGNVGPFPLLIHLFQMIARLWVGFSGQQTRRVLCKSYNVVKLGKFCTTMRSSPNNSQLLMNESKLKTWMAVKG